MSHTVAVTLLSLTLLADPASAQLFEPLPLTQALQLAAGEGVVCVVAYPGDEPDPAFDALLADPDLAEWIGRGAVAVLAPADGDRSVPFTLRVDWRPALAAVEPDGERVRFRIEDWRPAEVVAWLDQVAAGRGLDDSRALIGREEWARMQQEQARELELQLLASQGRLEELSERLLEGFEARARNPLRQAFNPVPWTVLQAALAHGEVDAEPWYELLVVSELPLRRGDVQPEEVQGWLQLLSLLDAHERLAPALTQALAAGADSLLDEEWSPGRGFDETQLAQALRRALLEHAAPADAGALIPDLSAVVDDALDDLCRGPLVDVSEGLWDEIDGPQSGTMRLSQTMMSLTAPMGEAFDAQRRRAALDAVAAAYHAALAAGRRAEARAFTTAALSVASERAAESLPDLERRLRRVDDALRAAGLEPIAWDTATRDDASADADADADADAEER